MGVSPRSDQWKAHWDKIRKSKQAAINKGTVIITLTGRHHGWRLHVSAPDNDDFLRGAIALHGSWRKRSQMWSFANWQQWDVLDLCKSAFGPDKMKVIEVAGFRRIKRKEPKIPVSSDPPPWEEGKESSNDSTTDTSPDGPRVESNVGGREGLHPQAQGKED